MAKQSSGRSRSHFADSATRMQLMRYKLGQIGHAEATELLMRLGKLDSAQAEALLRTAHMVKVDHKLLEKYGYE